jgi:hypothetical protein
MKQTLENIAVAIAFVSALIIMWAVLFLLAA